MAVIEHLYDDSQSLVEAFSNKIVNILQASIDAKGSASFAVSGGSTPKPLFHALSKCDLAWDKVTITLVDDRWVSPEHDSSNEKLVRENLLINAAADATFVPLTSAHEDATDAVTEIDTRIQKIGLPIDVLILGMGGDSHTASLFPCCEQIEDGLDLQRDLSVLATQPTTAPFQRMSLSLASIVSSPNVFLHIQGQSKRDVLNSALAPQTVASEKPIRAVCDNCTVQLVWAP